MELLIGTMAILMVFSAFFSSSETTLFSLTRATLSRWKNDGSRMQKLSASLMDDHHSTLTAILLGNNFVNLFSALVLLKIIEGSTSLGNVTDFLTSNLPLNADTAKEIISIIINTCILLIFGELTPKALAYSMPTRLAPKIAGPVSLLRKLFFPLIYLLKHASSWILSIIGGNKKSHGITADEYVTFTRLAHQIGVFETCEIDLFEKVFALREIQISKIMTPRPDIIYSVDTASVDEIEEKAMSSLHTMLPIVEEDLDHIVGILDVKAFIILPENERLNWKETCLLPPLYLPETSKADIALEQLRENNRHLALVVNEYGGIEGVLTTEDLLEEIVGEIYDEFDQPHWDISAIRDNEWRIAGPAPLSQLSKDLGIDFGTSEADTIAGYLAERLDHLPKKGEVFVDPPWSFRVKRLKRHRVLEVDVRRPPLPEASNE